MRVSAGGRKCRLLSEQVHILPPIAAPLHSVFPTYVFISTYIFIEISSLHPVNPSTNPESFPLLQTFHSSLITFIIFQFHLRRTQVING